MSKEIRMLFVSPVSWTNFYVLCSEGPNGRTPLRITPVCVKIREGTKHKADTLRNSALGCSQINDNNVSFKNHGSNYKIRH